NSINPALANALLGTKFKIIKGYTGGTDPLNVAMERGEIEGRSNNWTSWKALRPDWIAENKLSYLIQFGAKTPGVPAGIPAMADLVTTPKDKALVALAEIPQHVGFAVFAPPKIPAERLKALREAFDKAMTDQGFVERMEKLNLDLAPRSGAELQ